MSTHDDYPALIPSTGKLTLRTPPAQGEPGNVVHPEHAKQKPVDPKRKKKKKNTKAATSGSQAALAFVFVALILGGLLFDQVAKTKVLTPDIYQMVRLALVLGAYVVLLLEAFSHSMLHGVLCVFFPPYVILYGLFFADGGASRGFTLALCVFLGTELYFQPKTSFLTQSGQVINGWIEGVNRKIKNSGRDEAYNLK